MNRKTYLISLALLTALLAAAGCSCKPTTGALQVDLLPPEAANAGAKWRVDGGEWRESGATVTGLSAGAHPVAFKELPAWNTPAAQDAAVVVDQTSVLTANYTAIPPSWHAAALPVGLGDAVPMDIDVPPAGGGWIVGIEMVAEAAKSDPLVVFEGEGPFDGGGPLEGEMAIPTPPTVTGLVLRRTADGWSKASLPDLGTNWGLYAVSGQTQTSNWMTGGDFTQPPVEVSVEGEGETADKENPAQNPYGAVALRDPGTGMMAGTTNADEQVLTAVAALGSQDVWLGTTGGIVRLTNGTWTNEALPAGIETIQGLAFLNANDGWAVGSSGNTGAALRRAAGVWTTATMPALTEPWEILGIAALANGEAWAVGQSTDETALTRAGVLLHCNEGTWQPVPPPAVSTNWYLEAVSFPTANEGWAVGTDLTARAGVVLHYRDGAWGRSQVPAPEGGNWNLIGVSFTSPGEGWAVGYDNANAKMLLYRFGV